MSLINDALKKAQRERAAEDPAGASVASGLAGRRSQPKTAQSAALIAAGAVVLVAGSVAGTLFLLNRSSPPRPTSIEATPKGTSATPLPAASPGAPPIASSPVATEKKIPESDQLKPSAPAAAANVPPPVSEKSIAAPVVPKSNPSTTIANKAAVSSPVASSGSPPNAAPGYTATNPAPLPATTAATPTPAPASQASPPAAPSTSPALEERIHAFLEGLKIAGARAAGPDSRVLMNDKFYRLNEIVDRNLQLRLIKVEANSLTFSDANGLTYVRYF
jgi:hypothetical protein